MSIYLHFMHSSADGNQFISYLHYYKSCYYAYESVAMLWIYISKIDFWLLLLCFLRNFHFIFHKDHAKTYSHQGYTRGPILDTSSNTFGFLCDYNSCDEIPNHGFNIYFPNYWWCWAIFPISINQLLQAFDKSLFRSSSQILRLLFLFWNW